MRDDLERVRDWAKGQTRIGRKRQLHRINIVTLIESADAILHEMAVAASYRAAPFAEAIGSTGIGDTVNSTKPALFSLFSTTSTLRAPCQTSIRATLDAPSSYFAFGKRLIGWNNVAHSLR